EPVYEWQWVQEGTKFEERMKVERQRVPVGVETKWVLEKLPVERSNMNYKTPDRKSGSPFNAEEKKMERLEGLLLEDDLVGSLPKEELNLIEELRSAGEKPVGYYQTMNVTNPLHIRAAPGSDSTVLTIASSAERVSWTGKRQVLGESVWCEVRYRDKHKGTLIGWVNKAYLRQPEKVAFPTSSSVANPVDPRIKLRLSIWHNVLTPDERLAIVEKERKIFKEMWQEIKRLTVFPPNAIQHGLLPQEELDAYNEWLGNIQKLLKKPSWYLNGDIPPSFLGIYQLSNDLQQAFGDLLLNPGYVTEDVSMDTWEIFADAMGMTSADFMMSILNTAPWSPEAPATAGNFPITLYVSDMDGVRLRKEPTDGSESVTDDIRGVPYSKSVTWRGKYYVGKDSVGNRRVYYYVQYVHDPTKKTYLGWVPSEYLSPEVVSVGQNPAIYGSHPVTTFGYGSGRAGWKPYYKSGPAQNLNLELLFKNLGYPDHSTYANPHQNLCGQLAVMEAVRVSLEEGFRRFSDISDSYKEILQDPKRETNARHLKEFFNVFGWNYGEVSGDEHGIWLENALKTGKSVIALVTIDRSTGRLSTKSENGTTAHWVGVKNYKDGRVTVYNPYNNSYQGTKGEIPWKRFQQAWVETPFNKVRYHFVWGSRG
nr:SH3 domain-containing protein [Anaerolineales bacterium]